MGYRKCLGENMKNKVSVIVPVYNVVDYIEKCISSIRNQSHRNLQIILVDDGSTDGSGTICDEYQKWDKRIMVIHKPNGGLVSARKAGLLAAEGEYVLNIDADDWIEPDMVETLLTAALVNEVDIVCSAHFLEMGHKSKKIINGLCVGKYHTKDIRSYLLYNGTFFQFNVTAFIWSKLFKRNILEKTQYPVDEVISFGEDVVVTFPSLLYAQSIYITDYAGYHYVQREGSITNRNDKNELQRDMALVHYLYKFFSAQEDADVLLKQLNQYAKLMLLLRQLDWFDKKETSRILTPFGGIPANSRVVIYGAGKLGQNVYQYLNTIQNIQIVGWLDQSYCMYWEIGYEVYDPDSFDFTGDSYDYIIVSVSEEPIVDAIVQYLVKRGAVKKKIRRLTEQFIETDCKINYKSIAICGFRKFGRELYEQLIERGIYVPYIIERNYQALSETERIDTPIVGFDSDIYDRADVIILTSDLPENVARECLKLAGITVPLLPYKEGMMETLG